MKKFELTADDYRAGKDHLVRKMAEYLQSMDTVEKKEESNKDFSDIQEFDLENKVTAKELAEEFNKLVAIIKK